MARVAVVGPGAIGATFAAATQAAGGHDLLLCARRPLDGLVVEPEGGEAIAVNAPVETDPARVRGPVGWVLLAVKAHQTTGASGWLRALCGEDTVVVVLQNGVEQRELVAPLAAAAAVVPAVVWCPAQVVATGRVRVRGEVRAVVPDDDGGRGFADLLAGSDARIEPVGDFMTEAWRKLAVNAVAGLMALAGRPAEIFHRDDVRAVARALAAECVAVARAEGAALGEGDADRVLEDLAALPPDLGSSILIDRAAGRALEWDARNGVVCRLGARHGIATPVSDVIRPLLAAASGDH